MGESTPFQSVDRRRALSVEEFNREYRNRVPVVVTDALDGWKARSAWSLEQLRSRYGKTVVHVQGFQDGKPRAALDQRMLLGDYIDNILAKDFRTFPYYLRDNHLLFVEHRELRDDFRHPKYCFDWFQFLPGFLLRPGPRLFIGPGGTTQNLHQDMWGTFFWMAQLAGRKRWILFSPDQKEFLYPPKDKTAAGSAPLPIQPDKPDPERYPLFKKARGLECICGPGDLIIVPRDWFHWVQSLDPTVSLTHNYMARGNLRSCLIGQFKWSLAIARNHKAAA
jgi:Cupin-like domain